jgi:GNAT superfamily N-acetyltransferase
MWFSLVSDPGDEKVAGRFKMPAMETPTIRLGTPEDAALLSTLAASTFHATFAAENRPEDMKAYMDEAFTVERQTGELTDPQTTVLLAFVEGEPAGYAKLYTGRTPACVDGERPVELARLYADGKWHGRGVGAALLEACLDAARREGFRTMWLGVWERNWRAIAFYRKWGFVECGSQVFQLGSDPQTDMVMSREL